MKVTRIATVARRERARIYVQGEDRPRLELPLDVVLRFGLAVGDILDDALLAELEREDEVYRARDAALRLLAHRARSVAELRQRLERRDIAAPVVDTTLAWLDERGYLDDRAFAESFVRDRLRLRPRGKRGLLQELRRKGVDPATAEAATAAVLTEESVDQVELAIDAGHAWARKNVSLMAGSAGSVEDRQRARRRLYGHLGRRGFDAAAVRSAVEVVLGD